MQKISFLIVDSDPYTFELISEQILADRNFIFHQAQTGQEAITQVAAHQPDLVYLNLNLADLNGGDVLIGFQQKGYQGVIIVGAERDHEKKAINAFRLGAKDFVTTPIRPPELLSAIERALKDIKLHKERQQLMEQIQTSNANLQSKLNELTALSTIGHLLTSMRSIDELLDIVLSSMIDLTKADYATIILKDPKTEVLTMAAAKQLPITMQDLLGKEVRDSVASLVLTSREPLMAGGKGLQRFKLPREIKAVAYIPMLAHNKTIGVLTVGNYKSAAEFTKNQTKLLQAIGDYVAIGVTNARLFSALDTRARSTEYALKRKHAEQQELISRLIDPLNKLDSELSTIKTNGSDESQVQIDNALKLTQYLQQMVKQAESNPSKGIHRIS